MQYTMYSHGETPPPTRPRTQASLTHAVAHVKNVIGNETCAPGTA
jgi:hypothetical protein